MSHKLYHYLPFLLQVTSVNVCYKLGHLLALSRNYLRTCLKVSHIMLFFMLFINCITYLSFICYITLFPSFMSSLYILSKIYKRVIKSRRLNKIYRFFFLFNTEYYVYYMDQDVERKFLHYRLLVIWSLDRL